MIEIGCRGTELNRRRQPFQGCALPPELPRHNHLILASAGLTVKNPCATIHDDISLRRSLAVAPVPPGGTGVCRRDGGATCQNWGTSCISRISLDEVGSRVYY
jgi:hypothetical protein